MLSSFGRLFLSKDSEVNSRLSSKQIFWSFSSFRSIRHCLWNVTRPRPRFDGAGSLIPRFKKKFRDGKVIHISGPFDNIVGDCEIRTSGYIAQNLGSIRG